MRLDSKWLAQLFNFNVCDTVKNLFIWFYFSKHGADFITFYMNYSSSYLLLFTLSEYVNITVHIITQ